MQDVAVKVLINQDLQEEQLDEFKREVRSYGLVLLHCFHRSG